MKIRKEPIILGILIVSLAVYLLARKGDRRLYDVPELPAVEISDLSRIEIETPDARIALHRNSGGWVVGPEAYPADEGQLTALADTIANLTLTTLVAESGNFERYALDADHRTTVIAWCGERQVRNMDVGRQVPSSRHTFVRLAGDHRVFHARGTFGEQFRVSVDGLRDKSVLRFDKDRIHTIRFTKGERSVSLFRERSPGAAGSADPAETAWRTDKGAVVESPKLDTLVDQLKMLTCKQYIYDRAKKDFTDPVFTVTLEGDKIYALSIFEEAVQGVSDYPAVSSHSDYPFLLQKWQLARIVQDPDDIRVAPQ